MILLRSYLNLIIFHRRYSRRVNRICHGLHKTSFKIFLLPPQIRWLMTIRTPAKVFFQMIVPPILLIAGLSILRGNKDKTSAASGPQPLHLTPDLYLKPGSDADYATNALLQNSTNHAMGYVLAYLTQYSVGATLVSSIKSVLSSSSHALYNLGFNIREFPADFNLSQASVSVAFIRLKTV